MIFIKMPHYFFATLAMVCLIICTTPLFAQSEETDDTFKLFADWQESVSSASRTPKPLSQTAENITIITAREIEALNAHTLADALETVPGVQVRQLGGPGSWAYVKIQGTSVFQTQVLLDGVPLNNSGSFADVAIVPARIIERIEIVKGTASSAWGRALGGVINVITKRPGQRPLGGSVSTSIGESTTVDTGAELTGSSGRLGYYLSGGYLGSNGVLPQRTVYSNNAYGKLTYDLPGQGQIWGTINHSRAGRVDNYTTLLDFKEDSDQHYLTATLGLNRPLTEQLEMELNAYYFTHNRHDDQSTIRDGSLIQITKARERVGGGSGKLVWRNEHHLVVGGFEYEHLGASVSSLLTNSSPLDHQRDRFSFYLNDTISVGPLSVIPGGRFDKNTEGSQFSPSLGTTLRLGDNNLLRVYTGRGYSLVLNDDASWGFEKIWTIQIGMESTSVPYLWLKGTLLRNETWNVQDNRNLDKNVPERRIALGAEFEARTTPVFNTSLGVGYLFMDTTHAGNGSQVYSAPRHTVQLSMRYDDKTFRGVLTGRHIYWNGVPAYNGKYGGMIWDLHLGAKLLKREFSSLEVFLSARNLFNGAQYPDEIQPNTGRWVEGGVNVRF